MGVIKEMSTVPCEAQRRAPLKLLWQVQRTFHRCGDVGELEQRVEGRTGVYWTDEDINGHLSEKGTD